jgi:hypothetical protein
MHHYTKITAIAALLVSLFVFSACDDKTVTPTAPSNEISIISIVPEIGLPGDTITVSGANFDKYNDIKLSLTLDSIPYYATITLKQSNQLKFIIPNIPSGKYSVSILYDGASIKSGTKLTVDTIVPKIMTVSSFTPSKAEFGDTIALSGSNFDLYDLSLSLNQGSYSKIIPIVQKHNDLIKFIVPDIKPGNYTITIKYLDSSLSAWQDLMIFTSKIFAIKSFTPAIGVFSDTITVSGTNFNLYSNLSLALVQGNITQPVTIISSNSDELQFLLPNLKPGDYNIVLTCPDSTITAPNPLVIKSPIDFSKFRNMYLEIKNYECDYRQTSKSEQIPADPEVHYTDDTLYNYLFLFKITNRILSAPWDQKTDTYTYGDQHPECLKFSNDWNYNGNSLIFIKFNLYDISFKNNGALEKFTKLELHNVPYNINIDTLEIDLSGAILNNTFSSLSYNELYHWNSGHQFFEYNYYFIKHYPIREDTRVRIKLY